MLRVVHISFYFDPMRRAPPRLLEDWRSLVDVAEAVQSAGASVSVIQAALQTTCIRRNGIEYRFVAPERDGNSISMSAHFAALIRELRADVFHVHGFGFLADVTRLAEHAPSTPILIQDHADRPPRIWRRPSWRRALAKVSGVAFCARGQALPFVQLRLLNGSTRVFEIPESSSHFAPGDRSEARKATRLHGDPCVLWVGHLNSNKDPLTILEAIRIAAAELPNLQLWCCFASGPLLDVVNQRIERHPELGDRVHLLGQVPHAQIELLMRAADIFVLGSHREGSGYSLIEALACGLTAAVTDISSFRTLTSNGAIGELWRCGDAEGLARALLKLARNRPSRDEVRAHFDAELSFDAVGRKLVSAYQELRHHSALRTDTGPYIHEPSTP